jgi:hypothetical protein
MEFLKIRIIIMYQEGLSARSFTFRVEKIGESPRPEPQ